MHPALIKHLHNYTYSVHALPALVLCPLMRSSITINARNWTSVCRRAVYLRLSSSFSRVILLLSRLKSTWPGGNKILSMLPFPRNAVNDQLRSAISSVHFSELHFSTGDYRRRKFMYLILFRGSSVHWRAFSALENSPKPSKRWVRRESFGGFRVEPRLIPINCPEKWPPSTKYIYTPRARAFEE